MLLHCYLLTLHHFVLLSYSLLIYYPCDLCAEKLPILFHVCIFHHSSVLVHLCLLLGKHQENHGCISVQSLEGFHEITCVRHSNPVHIHCCLVCWRTHNISPVFNLHQPGSIEFPHLSPLRPPFAQAHIPIYVKIRATHRWGSIVVVHIWLFTNGPGFRVQWTLLDEQLGS